MYTEKHVYVGIHYTHAQPQPHYTRVELFTYSSVCMCVWISVHSPVCHRHSSRLPSVLCTKVRVKVRPRVRRGRSLHLRTRERLLTLGS